MTAPLVFLTMPTVRNPQFHAMKGFHRPTERNTPRVEFAKGSSIGVPFSCNILWAEALNEREHGHKITHFALMHDDVCPEGPWLDVLMDVMDETGADMVSAAVPIKDGRGLTSTAVDNKDDNTWLVRRITMHELHNDLPETFTSKDIPWADGGLLANTGLFVCRFGEWAEKVAWNQHNRIKHLVSDNNKNVWMAEAFPEDWDFCRQLNRLGLKIAVTRRVPLYHERPEFTTRTVWGEEHDNAWLMQAEPTPPSPSTSPAPASARGR